MILNSYNILALLMLSLSSAGFSTASSILETSSTVNTTGNSWSDSDLSQFDVPSTPTTSKEDDLEFMTTLGRDFHVVIPATSTSTTDETILAPEEGSGNDADELSTIGQPNSQITPDADNDMRATTTTKVEEVLIENTVSEVNVTSDPSNSVSDVGVTVLDNASSETATPGTIQVMSPTSMNEMFETTKIPLTNEEDTSTLVVPDTSSSSTEGVNHPSATTEQSIEVTTDVGQMLASIRTELASSTSSEEPVTTTFTAPATSTTTETTTEDANTWTATQESDTSSSGSPVTIVVWNVTTVSVDSQQSETTSTTSVTPTTTSVTTSTTSMPDTEPSTKLPDQTTTQPEVNITVTQTPDLITSELPTTESQVNSTSDIDVTNSTVSNETISNSTVVSTSGSSFVTSQTEPSVTDNPELPIMKNVKSIDNLTEPEFYNCVTVIFRKPSGTTETTYFNQDVFKKVVICLINLYEFEDWPMEVLNETLCNYEYKETEVWNEGGFTPLKPNDLVIVYPSPKNNHDKEIVSFFVKNSTSKVPSRVVSRNRTLTALSHHQEFLSNQMNMEVADISGRIPIALLMNDNEDDRSLQVTMTHSLLLIILLAVVSFCILIIMIGLVCLKCRAQSGHWEKSNGTGNDKVHLEGGCGGSTTGAMGGAHHLNSDEDIRKDETNWKNGNGYTQSKTQPLHNHAGEMSSSPATTVIPIADNGSHWEDVPFKQMTPNDRILHETLDTKL